MPLKPIMAALSISLALSGCASISMTLLAVGANIGISHQINGLAYRTFTMPLPRVKIAARRALRRMNIKVESIEKTDSGEILHASASGRTIDVEIEALTATATCVRAVARKDWLQVDAATATEIISQTRRALGA